MADERASIEAYMSRFGLLRWNSFRNSTRAVSKVLLNIMPHFTALWDRLARSVLARDYPERWWGATPKTEEEDF